MGLFASFPVDEVTVLDIAGAAGMTPAAVYYHFASKEQILLEGMQQFRDALLVDEIGSLQDAIQDAARRGGIKGEPSVWKVKRSFWETLAEAKMDVRPNVILDLSRARSGGAALDEILMQGR